MATFLDQDIQNYESGRDYLPEVLTSQLSVALAYGLLDIIEILMIYWRVMMKMRQTMKHLYVNSFLEILLCVNDTVSRNLIPSFQI